MLDILRIFNNFLRKFSMICLRTSFVFLRLIATVENLDDDCSIITTFYLLLRNKNIEFYVIRFSVIRSLQSITTFHPVHSTVKMKNSCVLLLTISIGMFLSLGSASPTTGITAETQPMQAHHLQRRAVIFRPLFVYRQQELSKQKKREESLQDRLDYQQQLAEHQRLMKEYEKQLREYEQRQQQQKQHHGHHHH